MADGVVHGNCWVAYLDILGFRNMLMEFGKGYPGRLDLFVKNHYRDVLDVIQRRNGCCRNVVSIAWFSDSFMLFSCDDTLESFAHTASFAGDFFRESLCRDMPLRGALGFGEFYAKSEDGIFLGPALIDAHAKHMSKSVTITCCQISALSNTRSPSMSGLNSHPHACLLTGQMVLLIIVGCWATFAGCKALRGTNTQRSMKRNTAISMNAPLPSWSQRLP
jgi:hypothetical protein